MVTHQSPLKPAELKATDIRQALPKIERRIAELKAFDVNTITRRYDPKVRALEDKIEATLVSIFGPDTLEYKKFKVGNLDKARLLSRGSVPLEEVKLGVTEGIKDAVVKLKTIIEILNERLKDSEGIPTDHTMTVSSPGNEMMPDPRKVFVVHGRDEQLRESFFSFLRALDLHPLEWSEAVKDTGKASPYIGEILDRAFGTAQAIIVLLTPDDEARLSPELWLPEDGEKEKNYQLQARPNALFEAGMAFGRNPDRTLLISVGRVKYFSDIGGRHIIRLTNDAAKRKEVAERLQTAGCVVSTGGQDWLKEGDFSVVRNVTTYLLTEKDQGASGGLELSEEEPSVKLVDAHYPRDSGLQAELESQGYEVKWCSDIKLARHLDLEGWALVIQNTSKGKRVILITDNPPHKYTLIMRRRVDHTENS